MAAVHLPKMALGLLGLGAGIGSHGRDWGRWMSGVLGAHLTLLLFLFSSHQGHAVHLRDLREVLQAQHVPQGPFAPALWGKAF